MAHWHRCLLSILLAVSALAPILVRAAGPEEAIPKALQDWQAWVLKGQEFRRCPFLASAQDAGTDSGQEGDKDNGQNKSQNNSQNNDKDSGKDNDNDKDSGSSVEDAYQCVWPERLVLAVDARGGHFSQRWQVYSPSWVGLPGDEAHWPQAVDLDGHPAALVARDGMPFVHLTPGAHQLSGRWSWEQRPETLQIPAETALLDLTVDGAAVPRPERSDGELALGRQAAAAEPRELELQIYRLLQYDEPTLLTTRLRIRAAGDAREESLGQVLPEGFVPVSVTSPLPARLDASGILRVQIRPGQFELTLEARQAGTASLRMPQNGSLVDHEVWSFAANDHLGVVTADGAQGVDPAQAQVPAEWRRNPAFEMTPDAQLRLTEQSRGLSSASQDRLRLTREMWLDFDHQGWTVRDRLSGTLRSDWRLDMRAPYELDNARAEGDTLLVTASGGRGERGVELRSPALDLTALARLPKPFAAHPATGWTESIESLSGTLYLPPGHRLLAVLGADEAPTAWFNRWGLWNLFGVLVVIVFARWVAGWQVALTGGLGLLLSCQQEPVQVLFWANLLAALALVRAAEGVRLARLAAGYGLVSLVLMLVVLTPFAVLEVRDSIHPQLEGEGAAALRGAGLMAAHVAMEPQKPAAPPPLAPSVDRSTPEAAPDSTPSADQRENRGAVDGKDATAAEVPRKAAQRYAPGANIQAGPGVPAWNYGSHPFALSGPVEPSQTVRFVVLGPVAVALWRIAGVALLIAFLVQLARLKVSAPPPRRATPMQQGLAAVLLFALLTPPGHAQPLPDPRLLDELRTRLTETPSCAPTCAELLDAQVHIAGERLSAELRASSLARTAISLPSGAGRWQIDTVLVDGASALAVRRQEDSSLLAPLEPGVHTLRIEGRLFGDSVHLAFPMTPRAISFEAPGWRATGVSGGRLLSGALDLTRQQPAAGAAGSGGTDAQEFPPFVRVVRDFQLGADWSITTTVERVSPSAAAFTVSLPLIPGESVLSAGTQVNADGTVLVGLAAGEDSRKWSSSLTRGNALAVHLPAAPARAEVWLFTVSPQWHVAFRGLPAVLPESPDANPWVYEYMPRPGEGLDLTVTQPQAVAGSTLAIDQAVHGAAIGLRSSAELLALSYRSTQGGRQVISLPEDASVTRVLVDNTAVPLRPERGQLALSILPGDHTVQIEWRSPQGAAIAGTPGRIDLHAPASNVRTLLSLPQDRWPLLALGSGVGPAFLYWSELALFVVVAVVLSRWRYSPLSLLEWLLLGLGLSTLSWPVLVLTALWLFAMSWRERATLHLKPSEFNALQSALVLLTAVAVGTLVFSGIRYGLLSEPDMGVTGPGSGGGRFQWFVDRTVSVLPRPAVYSVPLAVYRVVMFAWAVWIAFALTRWLRFAWRAWTAGGHWRSRPGAENAPLRR